MNHFLVSRFSVKWPRHRPKCGSAAQLVRAVCCVALCGLAITATVFSIPPQPNEARAKRSFQKSNDTLSGDARNGKLVFTNQGCNKCHGSEGEGTSPTSQNRGPQIASTDLALTAFVKLVRNPIGRMPAYNSQRLPDSELSDVYAFLGTVSAPIKNDDETAANATNGKKLFMRYGCYECHGSAGQGAQQTGGPRLGPPQTSLSAFVSYVRQPTGGMPPYTTRTASNEELADMYAFLKSQPYPPKSKTIPLLNQ